MKRCAIAIGVNKTGGLPVLTAAAKGATDFADWAASQGIEVAVLTDDDKVVCVADIIAAVKKFVDKHVYNQIIVFFSGHGLLNGPEMEVWLLSDAQVNPNEAVNVSGSMRLARNAGIPHIVFISDACRSRPDTMVGSQIMGSIIFPNEPVKKPRPDLDVFYATLPGNPAYEAPAAEASKDFRGLFTDCLLRGLRGEAPKEKQNGDGDVVIARGLKDFLLEEVPEAASEVDIKLLQDPEIRVESYLPNFLSEVKIAAAAAPAPAMAPPPMAPPPMPGPIVIAAPIPPMPDDEPAPQRTPLRRLKKIAVKKKFSETEAPHQFVRRDIENMRTISFERAQPPAGAVDTTKPMTRNISEAMSRIVEAQGRLSFETRTGFTLVGAHAVAAKMSQGTCDLFNENNAQHVRVHQDNIPGVRSQSCLITLDSGLSCVFGVLPGSIGTAVFKDDLLMTVNYTPSQHTGKYHAYEHYKTDLTERRAFAAVAAANGLFRFKNRDEAARAGDYLRIEKSIDPTLGLYAAYAYADAGQIEEAESVFQYMSYEPEPILFDVALAAGMLDDLNYGRLGHPLTPFCPMMSRGWSWLIEDGMPDVLGRLRPHLVPGLWTMFTQQGTTELHRAFDAGEVK